MGKLVDSILGGGGESDALRDSANRQAAAIRQQAEAQAATARQNAEQMAQQQIQQATMNASRQSERATSDAAAAAKAAADAQIQIGLSEVDPLGEDPSKRNPRAKFQTPKAMTGVTII